MAVYEDIKKRFEEIENDKNISDDNKSILYADFMTILEQTYGISVISKDIQVLTGNIEEDSEIMHLYKKISDSRNL